MKNSIFSQLVLTSLILLGFVFVAIYTAIIDTTVNETTAAQKEQMQLQAYILLSSASIEDSRISMPEESREPRFDQYKSGIYGFISNQNGEELWRSYSGHELKIDSKILQNHNDLAGTSSFSIYKDYFAYQHSVSWEIADDKPETITFTVLADRAPSDNKIKQFKQTIHLWFAAIVFAVIAALLLTLQWVTRPLRGLSRSLAKVEKGLTQQLEGTFPTELQPLVDQLNALITVERQQRERYRTTLADLAHSLKTPLAVIQAELQLQAPEQRSTVIVDQAARIEDIIRHQLQRAVLSKGEQPGASIPIAGCVKKIIAALGKVFQDKKIDFIEEIDPDATFQGDQRDLMEVLGNILDNACKACRKRVKIVVTMAGASAVIAIHDDGPGIAKDQREQVLKRGQRLDTSTHGHGLGLDISRDIIDGYGGKLQIQQSALGGALFRIELPG